MKKTLIGIGAVFISLLLISTVTAIPQTNSEPAMDLIEQLEEKKSFAEMLEQKIKSNDLPQPEGFIDWITQFLLSILNFVQWLVQLVLDLVQVVSLIATIISAINQLINAITQLLDSIMDIFNPSSHII